MIFLLVPAPSRALAAEEGQIVRKVAQAPDLTASDIVVKYGGATVVVSFTWRLYDAASGRKLYQRVVNEEDTGRRYPAFVRLPGGEIVRWLTLDDPDGINIAVGSTGGASGFVAGNQGFILTGKHAAAGWTLPYEDLGAGENFRGLGIVYDLNEGRKQKGEVVLLDTLKMTQLKEWVPKSGGLLFQATAPNLIGGGAGDDRLAGRRAFLGKHDFLEVRFPGSRIGAEATVVRTSIDGDAALIKIESAQTLSPVELAPEAEDDSIEVGDRVVVLTYLRESESSLRVIPLDSHWIRLTPEPIVLEGIVAVKVPGVKRKRELTGVGIAGDAYQLSINSAGADSGGPVFNHKGQVVGLFASAPGQKGVAYAAPIKHGRMLLSAGRAN